MDPVELVAALRKQQKTLTTKHGLSTLAVLNELTLLTFLRAAPDVGFDAELPKGSRWADLTAVDGVDQFDQYRGSIIRIGAEGSARCQAVFAGASSSLPNPQSLSKLVAHLDAVDWFDLVVHGHEEGPYQSYLFELFVEAVRKGNLRTEQQPTPRPLARVIVRLLAPELTHRVQDPATGTGGFLVEAHRYISAKHDLWSTAEQVAELRRTNGLVGLEIRPEIYRYCTVNLMLHGVEGRVARGDTLSPTGAALPNADIVVTNPSFGTQARGEQPSRDDLTFPTSNKQFAFLQHVYRALKPGGRAAMVVPDDILFDSTDGPKVRAALMDKCDLHTILRLPDGIYAKGSTRTNVLFFRCGEPGSTRNTEAVWIYDLRTNMPSFGVRTPFQESDLADFEALFGDDPNGQGSRTDQGEEGRWRRYSREAIHQRGEDLDITWLRPEGPAGDEELDPAKISQALVDTLDFALGELRALRRDLGLDDSAEE